MHEEFTKEIAEIWFELVKTQCILENVLKEKGFSLSEKDIKNAEELAFKAVKNRLPFLDCKKNR